MTEPKKVDAQALPLQLQAARNKMKRLRQKIIQQISLRDESVELLPHALALSIAREYGLAVLEVTSLEAQIEEHSSAIYGVVQGGALNLDDAKREVFDRIARFRERSRD